MCKAKSANVKYYFPPQVGSRMYIAGQIPLIPGSMEILSSGIQSEARLALRHVSRVLAAMHAGSDITHADSVVCYVTHPDYVEAVRFEWQKYLSNYYVSSHCVKDLSLAILLHNNVGEAVSMLVWAPIGNAKLMLVVQRSFYAPAWRHSNEIWYIGLSWEYAGWVWIGVRSNNFRQSYAPWTLKNSINFQFLLIISITNWHFELKFSI